MIEDVELRKYHIKSLFYLNSILEYLRKSLVHILDVICLILIRSWY